jgi:signal transduction histidine kinase
VPRELGYLLLSFPIAIVTFTVSIFLFSLGVGTLLIWVGVVILVLALVCAGGFAWLERRRLGWSGHGTIETPVLKRRPGFLGWLGSTIRSPHSWLYLLHALVVNFVLATLSWTITIAWITSIVGLATPWWWADDSRQLFHVGLELIVRILAGLFCLVTLPFVTFGLTWVHHVVGRTLLGAFPSEGLTERVEGLAASRDAAVSAEGSALRRLERDIHDGPQQRLVRIQMDLAAAERALDKDADRARVLVGEATQQAKDALEELRALSRGFAPPLLLDRGLVAALESAAARSSVNVTVASELDAALELPTELERNAYFIGSELITNAVKHADASAVVVRLRTRRVPEPDEWWLDLAVSDDGRGGAHVEQGHGLAGLEERVRRSAGRSRSRVRREGRRRCGRTSR